MCARFSQTASPEVLERLLEIDLPDDISPLYNIAPTEQVLAVIQGAEGREVKRLRWGLVPIWAKDLSVGQRLINARAETVAEKPSFRDAYRRRRCLIPATSFFEWREESVAEQPSLLDDGPPRAKSRTYKQPYLFRLREGEPFAFAGLWERWQAPEGSWIETCSILTTSPNELLQSYHDRMPCILDRQDFQSWLSADVEAGASLAPLLAPISADRMEHFPVTTAVSNPRNKEAVLVQPTSAIGGR